MCPLMLLLSVSTARGQQPQFVFGDGSCPEPSALQAEVVRLTPSERRNELFDAVRVNVVDSGDGYRVVLNASGDRQEKTFADVGRDCSKRARFAAVFIVVTLFPPELDLEPRSGTETRPVEPGSETDRESTEPSRESAIDSAEPVAPAAPPSEPSPQREHEPDAAHDEPFDPIARIELTADGHLAPAMGDAVAMNKLGAEVLAVLGRGSVLLTFGVGYTLPTRFEAGFVRASMSELPARVGVRLPWQTQNLGFAVDAGIAGALRQLRGRRAVVPAESSELGLGVRLDAGAFYGLSERIRLLGGVHTTFEPAPSELRALPYGRVGTMPWLWFGARVGFGVSL